MTTIEREILDALPSGTSPADCFFVEAGAHDGVDASQTLYLERLGWRGICVEPDNNAFTKLIENRRCHLDARCLLDVDESYVEFREINGEFDQLSGIISEFQPDEWTAHREEQPHLDRMVATITLPTLLDLNGAPPVIQLLVLDTEGSEVAILNAHDFDRYKFLKIIVEHNFVAESRNALYRLLEPKGYTGREAGKDSIFTHRDLSCPKSASSTAG